MARPFQRLKRQEILTLVEKFGAFCIDKENIGNIAIELLTEDFEAFAFSSIERTSPVQHYTRPQDFIDFWKSKTILERRIRTAYVDSDKSTAWQICEYKIVCEGDDEIVVEVACELFTIRDKRIAKYRASSGLPIPDISGFEKYFNTN